MSHSLKLRVQRGVKSRFRYPTSVFPKIWMWNEVWAERERRTLLGKTNRTLPESFRSLIHIIKVRQWSAPPLEPQRFQYPFTVYAWFLKWTWVIRSAESRRRLRPCLSRASPRRPADRLCSDFTAIPARRSERLNLQHTFMMFLLSSRVPQSFSPSFKRWHQNVHHVLHHHTLPCYAVVGDGSGRGDVYTTDVWSDHSGHILMPRVNGSEAQYRYAL